MLGIGVLRVLNPTPQALNELGFKGVRFSRIFSQELNGSGVKGREIEVEGCGFRGLGFRVC